MGLGPRSGVQLLVLGLLRGTGSGLRASVLVTEQTGREDNNVLLLKGLPLCFWCFPPTLMRCQRKDISQCQRLVKRKEIIYLKVIQSFLLPLPSLGYRISGKEVEVCDSGCRHHQLSCSHGVPTLPKQHGSPPSLPKPCGPLLLWLPHLALNPRPVFPCSPISDSSHNRLHLPALPILPS